MDADRLWTPTRLVHRAAWWVFVVATLVAGSVRWIGFGSHSEVVYNGSYEPLDDIHSSSAFSTALDISYDTPFGSPTWLTVLSLLAFVVVLIAAVLEAVMVRRLRPSAIAVVGPLLALIAMTVSLNGVGDSVVKPSLAVVGVLVAVAAHESSMVVSGRGRDDGFRPI